MQVSLHNHVLHALHGLVEQVGVGGVGEVHVGLLARVAHQVLEFACEELLAGIDVLVCAGVIREVLANRRLAAEDLLAEKIDLVEEKNKCGLLEVFAVGNAFEEHESFLHLVLKDVSFLLAAPMVCDTYAIAVFHQHVIVSADRDEEEYDLNVVEHVDPLLTL